MGSFFTKYNLSSTGFQDNRKANGFMKEIRGKRALLTGAASGIGRAMAFALAEEGVSLYLLDIKAEELQEVALELKNHEIEVIAQVCNLADSDAISQCLDDLLDEWEFVDIVINNAGFVFYGPTITMSPEQWDLLLKVNLLAPIQITTRLLTMLKLRPEAHILNMCSISGLAASGRMAGYHTSKFGLVGFTESLRAEFNRQGIGVTALCPGPVLSNMYRDGLSGREEKPLPTPHPMLCTTPEKVAKAAIKAIRKNKRKPILTPVAHLIYNAKRFVPGFIDFLQGWGRRRSLKKKALRHQMQLEEASATPSKITDENLKETDAPSPTSRDVA